jgi:hypothetical protein
MTESYINDQRLLKYLRQLADKDWGVPSGFGGHTCFQAIPALEMERRGESSGIFRWEWIDYSLNLLRQRKDCQDFSMVGLLWMLYRYQGSNLLTSEMTSEMEKVLLTAKYDENDPGEDSCCWHTENHQIQYASSEYLMGQLYPDEEFINSGKIGRWHCERGREKLYLWLDWRRRFSFSEWNSSCYYDDDAAALLNLIHFAGDPELRHQAETVMEMIVLHVALNSWNGITGASQGRAYLEQQIAPDETAMAIMAQVCWGDGDLPKRMGLAAMLLSAGDFKVSPEILAAGRNNVDDIENRERHGLDAEEASSHGVYPDRLRDYMFFMGAGQGHHHLVAEMNYVYHNGQSKWPGYYYDLEYYKRCKEQGVQFDSWALPHALGSANLYTFRTPEYMIGCAQDYHPGAPGYQQFIWSATLGERAVVFSTNPTPTDIPYGRPGPWVGNGVLPKVVQHRNVLIAMHRVRPCPIYDQPPWWREDRVHAWFPRGAFEEVIDQNGWCFGRKGDGYVALRPDKPGEWIQPDPKLSARIGSDEPYEWNVNDTDVVWVCEMGSARLNGTFARFIDTISPAVFSGDINNLSYESPTIGQIETGWQRNLTVAGNDISTNNYPLFNNQYMEAPFGVPFLLNSKEMK